MRIERTLLAFGTPHARQYGRILCYHSVGTPMWGVNDVPPARFRRHLELALAAGYRFVAADDVARTGGRAKDLAITFDDGLASVAANGAPILRDFGIPWSLFVVSRWADGDHPFGEGVLLGWRQIERLAAEGASIGSHSVTHRNFRTLSPAQAEEELLESRRTIAARTGIDATTFAIPFGQSQDWPDHATTAARGAGYSRIFAQSESRRPVGTIARTFITAYDDDRIFRAALRGAFDRWEEWI